MRKDITPSELQGIIEAALKASDTDSDNARSTAYALTMAEVDGKKGHGLSRVLSYAAQARSGKVNGTAKPTSKKLRSAVLMVDARHGFAYPAFDLMQKELPPLAKENGIALALICHSHHYGVAGHQTERLAEEGLMALLFGNTPAGIAPWGGKTPLFGTNPIAFAAPLKGRAPLVIDLATSKVARGGVLTARQKGESIPEGWALDSKGKPTTDPNEALKGSMVPMGEAKGAALALMIEVLAAGLTEGAFGNEASSFFEAEGAPPNTGQVMIAIDPNISGGNIDSRLTNFVSEIEADGARLPGDSRLKRREEVAAKGLTLDPQMLEAVEKLTTKENA